MFAIDVCIDGHFVYFYFNASFSKVAAIRVVCEKLQSVYGVDPDAIKHEFHFFGKDDLND